MNSEPCVRFGMRIRPKISEKPADNRNSSPPNVTLLTASTSQKFMAQVFLAEGIRRGLNHAMQRVLFPSPACGRGWFVSQTSLRSLRKLDCVSDREREPREGPLGIHSSKPSPAFARLSPPLTHPPPQAGEGKRVRRCLAPQQVMISP